MAMAVVQSVAAVTQLIGQVTKLVAKIIRAVETARQNRVECGHLACRVSTVHGVLSDLPQHQELAPPLKVLNDTLEEAHRMVIACRNRGAASQFFGSRRHADCFSQINVRIAADVVILNLCLCSCMARRHSNQVLHPVPNHIGAPTPTIAMAPWPGFSSASLQTQVSSISSDHPPRAFTWAEIAAATDFDAELSRGSSGTVYKGRLGDGGRQVAVKILNKHRHQRMGMEDAFMAEFEILRTLRHGHIVPLVGWCAEDDTRVFVYDHMSNGTLRDHLQRVGGGSSSSPVTTSWATRLQVLLGASRAIQYLHRHAAPPVIHRNISSSNILLDASWTPRLSSFGSAVLQAAGEEHGGQLVKEVVGTFEYLDPEYHHTGRVSPASDVYSFGVLLLEALTGKDPAIAVDSALPVIRNGSLWDMLDRRLVTARQLEALELVALTAEWCLCPLGKDRPAISTVVANLETALWNLAAQP